MNGNSISADLYDENELIVFDDGIFGFEEIKRYLPLPMDGEASDFICLLNVDDDNVSFVLVNPFSIMENYNPKLTAEDYKKLGTNDEEKLSYYAICVMKEVPQDSTVNLKCPIVVNTVTRKSVQVILQTDDYNFRHKFSELKKG